MSRASGLVMLWALPVGLFAWDAVQLVRAQAATDEGDASVSWPTAPGTITASSVGEHLEGRKHSFVADIAYAYAVDGSSRTGHTVRMTAFDPGSEDEAKAIVTRYPVGAAVTVHYDSHDSTHALLEPGAPAVNWQRKVTGVALVALVLSLGCGYMTFRTRPRRPANDDV